MSDDDDFASLPSFDANPYALQFLMLGGGTSLVELGGLDDDGFSFTENMIALHVKGKQFIGGDEVDGEVTTVVMMHLSSAEETFRNLGKTIDDYKTRLL